MSMLHNYSCMSLLLWVATEAFPGAGIALPIAQTACLFGLDGELPVLRKVHAVAAHAGPCVCSDQFGFLKRRGRM